MKKDKTIDEVKASIEALKRA